MLGRAPLTSRLVGIMVATLFSLGLATGAFAQPGAPGGPAKGNAGGPPAKKEATKKPAAKPAAPARAKEAPKKSAAPAADKKAAKPAAPAKAKKAAKPAKDEAEVEISVQAGETWRVFDADGKEGGRVTIESVDMEADEATFLTPALVESTVTLTDPAGNTSEVNTSLFAKYAEPEKGSVDDAKDAVKAAAASGVAVHRGYFVDASQANFSASEVIASTALGAPEKAPAAGGEEGAGAGGPGGGMGPGGPGEGGAPGGPGGGMGPGGPGGGGAPGGPGGPGEGGAPSGPGGPGEGGAPSGPGGPGEGGAPSGPGEAGGTPAPGADAADTGGGGLPIIPIVIGLVVLAVIVVLVTKLRGKKGAPGGGSISRLQQMADRLSEIAAHPSAEAAIMVGGSTTPQQALEGVVMNLRDAASALETGQDAAGNAITPAQVGAGLRDLHAACDQAGWALPVVASYKDKQQDIMALLGEMNQIGDQLSAQG